MKLLQACYGKYADGPRSNANHYHLQSLQKWAEAAGNAGQIELAKTLRREFAEKSEQSR